jgi:hypothetical protein
LTGQRERERKKERGRERERKRVRKREGERERKRVRKREKELLILFLKEMTEAGLLIKSSCLAAALGVTKFIAVIVMNLVTLCCAT